jgi:hypothetical protein
MIKRHETIRYWVTYTDTTGEVVWAMPIRATSAARARVASVGARYGSGANYSRDRQCVCQHGQDLTVTGKLSARSEHSIEHQLNRRLPNCLAVRALGAHGAVEWRIKIPKCYKRNAARYEAVRRVFRTRWDCMAWRTCIVWRSNNNRPPRLGSR